MIKRFSRKNKRRESSSKETEVNGSENLKQATPLPSGQKSKSNLMKSFRKKLQRTRSTDHYTKEHIYSPASPVQEIHSVSSLNNNNVTGLAVAPNQEPHASPCETFISEDHDYSVVSNDTDVTPPVSQTDESPTGNIYSNISTPLTSQVSPQNLNSPSRTVESVQFNSNSSRASNANNQGKTSSTKDPPLYCEPNPVKEEGRISLREEFHKLARKGWYWGPLSREQAEKKLRDLPEASFLVRDSSDSRYLLSLSFRSNNRTLHTRIEHSGVKFSFYEDSPSQCYTSVVDLIENSVRDSSEQGIFCYSRSRQAHAVTFPVRLMNPVSRFTEVRPLQDLCRFVIRQNTRNDHIDNLPVPNQIKGYLNQSYFF